MPNSCGMLCTGFAIWLVVESGKPRGAVGVIEQRALIQKRKNKNQANAIRYLLKPECIHSFVRNYFLLTYWGNNFPSVNYFGSCFECK